MKNVTKMLSRSVLLLTISILLFAKAGWAIDTFVQIGMGTVATSHPFYALYADNRDQLIYHANEMSPTLTSVSCHLVGHISNAVNGANVNGAKIVVNGLTTYSILDGSYALDIFPGGTFPVTITKAGFGDSTTISYVFAPAVTTTVDVAIKETTYKPSTPFVAALNGTPATSVALSWGVPRGDYELIYDDGIETSSTVWEVEGNMNAVKFTALNTPVIVKGGSVNIGAEGDYPAGTTVADLDPFQIQVYDASGAAGTPGAAIGDPIDVVPTSFGWNTFSLPNIAIASGNFFLVMIQGGAPPTACRIGVDTDNPHLRSYSKFVTGSGSWLPADGNFMIRAVVNGIGGPIDVPGSITGYQVYRLLQTQEATPALWTSVSTPTGTSTVDNSWPTLPDGAYRWAVKAQYIDGRWSGFTFSNVLGKNWTASVTVNVGLTCTATPLAGSVVILTSTTPGVDSVYTMTTNATGTATFPKVWKGPYHMAVSRIGYDLYSANVSILADQTFDLTLLQQKKAPTNMTVDSISLRCTWNAPAPITYLLFETFDGDFNTNGWSNPTGGWMVAPFGHPKPGAGLPYTLFLVNYDDINLISKTLSGAGAPDFKLKYDICLVTIGYDGNEQLEVEINDGGGWTGLKHYENVGDIDWTNETIDMAAYTNSTFQVRFRAHGDDISNILFWCIDNVQVVSTVPDPKPCILGYNVYLNGILDGVTPSANDTIYDIPGNHVIYGNSYVACVKAVYGSGTSFPSCAPTFISKWLCPPTVLTGTALESTAYLTWKKPSCSGSGPAPQWIRWDDGTNYDAIGTGGAFLFDIAARWDVSQIGALAGGSVTKIAFFPSTAGTATYKVRVWQGANAANLIVDQAVPSPVVGQWNEITLNTPAAIDVTQELWIGANVNATSGWPAGVDGGPAIVGYGDMIQDASTPWGSMMTLYALNYNWNLAAYIESVKSPNQVVILKQDKIVSTQKGQFAISGVKNTNEGATQANASKAPLAGPTLLGYNIKRDGAVIDFVGDPNTLDYYDYNLDPGTYTYEVTGYYDVAPFTPSHDNSQPAGPVDVTIDYGRPLPFFEPWNMGNFSFNDWTSTGDWVVTADFGNPAPSADFSGLALGLTNYTNNIESPTLSAASYTCATVYLDFDYKLIDRNATGAEFLTVEVFRDGSWKNITDYSNKGDVNWTSQHLELKSTIGKAFKIRFRAHGANSQDIVHWYVDNIAVYAVCTVPTALSYTQSHNNVTLSWTAPNCVKETPFSIILDDGTEESGFMINPGSTGWFGNIYAITSGTTGKITSADLFFNSWGSGYPAGTLTIDIFDVATGALLGSSAPFVQQDTIWINVPLPGVDFSADFYGMVKWDALPSDSYFIGFDEDGPYSQDNLSYYYDGSVFGDLQTLAYSYGVFLCRINGIVNDKKKDAQAISIMPGKKPVTTNSTKSAQAFVKSDYHKVDTRSHSGIGFLMQQNGSIAPLQGYNLYRTDSTANPATYAKINPAIEQATTYTDVLPLTSIGNYKYFVTSVFNDTIANAFLCESPACNEILVEFPYVGIAEIAYGQISVYPNPAMDVVNVNSNYNITRIDVMNFVGQTVYTNNVVTLKTSKINVASFTPGVYFLRVSTTEGVRTVKITVTH